MNEPIPFTPITIGIAVVLFLLGAAMTSDLESAARARTFRASPRTGSNGERKSIRGSGSAEAIAGIESGARRASRKIGNGTAAPCQCGKYSGQGTREH